MTSNGSGSGGAFGRELEAPRRWPEAVQKEDTRGASRGVAPVSVDRRATLLILDGAHPDVFGELERAGDLPNLSRHLLESGATVPATTVFPSTTGVAYLPMLTGCYPGTCDVPGIRWLDRRSYGGRWWRDRREVRTYCGIQGGLLDRDLDPGIPSLFDLVPESVGHCTPFTRGLTEGDSVALRRAVWGSVAHYTGRYGPMDRAAALGLRRAATSGARLRFVVFPGVDGATHFHDPAHPAVRERYLDFDRALGEYARRGGLEGDHLLVVASDHGAARVVGHQDLSVSLEARGIRTLRHPRVWRRDPALAVMVSGNASAQVYLRPGIRREHRWALSRIEAGEVEGIPSDLVEWMVALPGVGLVAATEGDDVVVLSERGRARLSPGGDDVITYRPLSGDVLGLGPETRTLPERKWLAESLDGPFPDAPTQLLQLFRSPRAGDLAVAAEPYWDLRDDWEVPEHKSGHGSLVAAHMRCVVAANRPVAGPLRTVDLFPLLLRHLGVEVPAEIDGRTPRVGRTPEPEAA